MRQTTFILAVVLASCSPAGEAPTGAPEAATGAEAPAEPAAGEAVVLSWPAGLPVYDHVVIVVEENKDVAEILGNAAAPYINNVLKAEGANFTRAFGEEHFSQGNYYWLFSGDNQGVGFFDKVPDKNTPGYPFQTANLGQQLIEKGLTFKGYAESLPAIGSTVVETTDEGGKTKIYARKHVPWISFANVPNGKTVETSSNLRFEDFPSDYTQLPTVSFVIPNLDNDMHNGDPSVSIPKGSRWLQDNLDAYYQWAKLNNSLLIVTFDEDNDRRHYNGLTDPFAEIPHGQSCRTETNRSDELEDACELQNGVVTIFAGAHIKPGDYDEGKGITHVNILRTLEAMYGLPKAGAQQPNAAKGGISDDYIITDVFVPLS